MASWDDPECYFPIRVVGLDDALESINPEAFSELACRVIKRPDCCALCAANEDCRRIPLHVRCHCVPEFYVMAAFGE